MADYTPPPGPPPPKAPEVPAGWVARWNKQYKEWFYVNVYTKKSQWDKPTDPVFPVGENAPHDPPPGYEPGSNAPLTADDKKQPYATPAATAHGAASSYSVAAVDEDAKLAARLQAEEDAKARATPGGPQPPAGYGGPGFYSSPTGAGGGSSSGNSPYPVEQYPQELPPRYRDKAKAGGFLGKLFKKGKTGGGFSPQPQPQPQQGYYQSPPPQQPHYGGGYPGYGPLPTMAGGSYGGYGGQPYMQQQQQPPSQQAGRKPGMGGMGMGLAGGALGLGAGVLGGALIADAIHDHDQEAYMEGYEDAQDNDFGGGDDFGGDF